MLIQKFGHCCLLIKLDGLTILTDPGTYTTTQDEVPGVDVVLITHEHADHFHIESLKKIVANNPDIKVYTNTSVGKLLKQANIGHCVVAHAGKVTEKGVTLEAVSGEHEEIYEDYGQVENTGFMVGGKLFYPGDAYTLPGVSVDVLALPVAGGWCKIADAIRYALEVKPKKAFPVHDGSITNTGKDFLHLVPAKILGEAGIEFVPMKENDCLEF